MLSNITLEIGRGSCGYHSSFRNAIPFCGFFSNTSALIFSPFRNLTVIFSVLRITCLVGDNIVFAEAKTPFERSTFVAQK